MWPQCCCSESAPPAGESKYIPLSVTTGDVGTNADLVEKVLHSFLIGANTIDADKVRIRIRAWGKLGANANGKIVRVRFGPVTLTGTLLVNPAATTQNARRWIIDCEIVRVTALTFVAVCHFHIHSNNGAPASSNQCMQVTDSTAFDPTVGNLIEITGLNSIATANDVICSALVVDKLKQP